MTKYTYNEIKNLEKPVNHWWYTLVLKPFVLRLVYLFANYIKFTPNQITAISFIFGLLSAFSFLQGTRFYLIVGAFLFEISYILDCVDGRIARLKGLKSVFGAYLDQMTDVVKYFFIILSLSYGQYLLMGDVSYLLLGIFFIFLHLTLFLSAKSLQVIEKEFSIETSTIISNNSLKEIKQDKFHFFWKIKIYFESKGLSSIPLSAVEAETFTCFIFPIIMQVKIGLCLGSLILLENIFIVAFFYFFMKWK